MEMNERLKDLMSEHGMTNKGLAEVLGVSQGSVSFWTRSINSMLLDTVVKLCAHFNCSLQYFSGKSDKEEDFSPLTDTFFNRLQKAMSLKNVTIYKLSKGGKVSKTSFYNWRKGAQPSLNTLVSLAKFFDCALDYLAGCGGYDMQ